MFSRIGWTELLRDALKEGLPGRPAQERMIPGYRRGVLETPPLGGAWRPASVLILLYPGTGGRVTFPLVERSPDMGHHRGEIGLPGGSLEEDEEAVDAARREAGEELGLDQGTEASIDIIGPLSPLRVPPSGFEVQPFVASLASRPHMLPREGEIVGIIETRLSRLLEPGCAREEEGRFEGKTWRVPFFDIDGHKVWGATAMMLAELAEVLRTLTRLAAQP